MTDPDSRRRSAVLEPRPSADDTADVRPAAATPSRPATDADALVARRHQRAGRTAALRRWVVRAAVLAATLLAWQAVTRLGLVQPLFLPSPGAVWEAFVRANSCQPVSAGVDRLVCGAQGYFLWEHLLASLQRIGIGVSAAVVVGVLVGFAMALVPLLGTLLEPYVNFLRALPPLGYIGLLIVWFGIGDVSKVWLLFLAAFPPVALATIAGVRGVRQDRVHAVQSLGASRLQTLRHVVLPASLPDIVHGVRLATGFAWTTVVAAELNNGIPGIGGLAYLSGTQLQTPLTIACIVVIGLAAVALDALLSLAGRLLVPWQGRA